MPADSEYLRHTHEWGEFVYSYSGVMEVKIGEHDYLATSQYKLWLPPRIEHQGLNRYKASHCSLYVSAPDLLGFVVCTTPVTSPQTNGMAEAFVKTFKRDYVYLNDLADAVKVMS